MKEKSTYEIVTNRFNSIYFSFENISKKKSFRLFNDINYELNDPFLYLTEIDQLVNEFPDTYKLYLECLYNVYLKLESKVKSYTESGLQNSPRDQRRKENLIELLNDINSILLHIESILYAENADKLVEIAQIEATPKGKTRLTREQTAILFFYLREKQLIAQPTNENMASAISILTGNSKKQIQEILRISETPSHQLGKGNDKVTRTDYKTVISELEKLIDQIKKDFKTYSDNMELK